MPLALAVLLPIGVLVALWAVRRASSPRPIWAVVVALTLLLAASARLAIQTGESQEDTVERVVAHDPLEEHEEAGERLFLVSAIALGLAAFGLAGGRVGAAARPLMFIGAIAILVAAFSVGKSGGALVYEHGAASAYTGPAAVDVAVRDDRDHE
jgi:peptidoglycan/LPS O-acetylase OafA/YrhL